MSSIRIDEVIRAVAELPDRDSPKDQPEMMLVSADELRVILEGQIAAPATPTDQQIVDTLARHGIGWGDEQGVTAYSLDGEDAPTYIGAVRELLAAPSLPLQVLRRQ